MNNAPNYFQLYQEHVPDKNIMLNSYYQQRQIKNCIQIIKRINMSLKIIYRMQ